MEFPIDLLQQVGMSKYEAEAYCTLLAEGPLTGYELGKRSEVPLSRSYEIIERLCRNGLALAQPGEPPRYAAELPEHVIARMQETLVATVTVLKQVLNDIQHHVAVPGFWVLRGRSAILARVSSLVRAFGPECMLYVSGSQPDTNDLVDQARSLGCQVKHSSEQDGMLLLLRLGKEALAGTIAPAAESQAVIGANAGLMAAIEAFFAAPLQPRKSEPTPASPSDWVAWEEHKHRHLWRLARSGRVA